MLKRCVRSTASIFPLNYSPVDRNPGFTTGEQSGTFKRHSLITLVACNPHFDGSNPTFYQLFYGWTESRFTQKSLIGWNLEISKNLFSPAINLCKKSSDLQFSTSKNLWTFKNLEAPSFNLQKNTSKRQLHLLPGHHPSISWNCHGHPSRPSGTAGPAGPAGASRGGLEMGSEGPGRPLGAPSMAEDSRFLQKIHGFLMVLISSGWWLTNPTPLKHMSSSDWIIITIGENKKCSKPPTSLKKPLKLMKKSCVSVWDGWISDEFFGGKVVRRAIKVERCGFRSWNCGSAQVSWEYAPAGVPNPNSKLYHISKPSMPVQFETTTEFDYFFWKFPCLGC